MSLIITGGSKPHFSALCHLKSLSTPTNGPKVKLRSNKRRMFSIWSAESWEMSTSRGSAETMSGHSSRLIPDRESSVWVITGFGFGSATFSGSDAAMGSACDSKTCSSLGFTFFCFFGNGFSIRTNLSMFAEECCCGALGGERRFDKIGEARNGVRQKCRGRQKPPWFVADKMRVVCNSDDDVSGKSDVVTREDAHTLQHLLQTRWGSGTYCKESMSTSMRGLSWREFTLLDGLRTVVSVQFGVLETKFY